MARINWNFLLGNQDVVNWLNAFAFSSVSVNDVSDALAGTDYAGEFRKLVRTHGTDYARNLTRKALRYRGIDSVCSS